jgi:hypothetical protein
MLENRSFPPAPILSQRSSPSRVRSRRARKRRALDRCGPLQPAPLRRKNKIKRPPQSFLPLGGSRSVPVHVGQKRTDRFVLVCRSLSWVGRFFRFLQKNCAPGSPRNDDLQLGRPPASPVLCFFRPGAHLASLPLRASVFIAPPRESSTLVREISPRKTHQTLVPGDRLPSLAAEPPDHDSAGSRAVDPHPRTTAAADDAQSR